MNREEIIEELNSKFDVRDVQGVADWHIAEVSKAIVNTIRADQTFNELMNRPIPVDREYLEKEIRKAKRETAELLKSKVLVYINDEAFLQGYTREILDKIIEDNK